MPGFSPAATRAEELKVDGNAAYKKEDFQRASEIYAQASRLQPENPVYLSNLSAAQFECGEYADALESTSKALRLLGSNIPDAQKALRNKILLRRAKTALQSADFNTARSALDDLLAADPNAQTARALRAAIDRVAEIPRGNKQAAMERISTLPRYRTAPKHLLEYYVVGNDIANSLLAPQANLNTTHSARAKQMRIEIPKQSDVPFEFTGMFAGVGDGRHLYATLADANAMLNLRKSSKGTAPARVRLHFTAIDINPTALARDLVMLFALEELAGVPASQVKTHPRARELLAMLHFAFWAAIMPLSAYDTLIAWITRVRDALRACAEAGSPLQTDTLYMESAGVEPVLAEVEWWLGPGKTPCHRTHFLLIRSADEPNDLRQAPFWQSDDLIKKAADVQDNWDDNKKRMLKQFDEPGAEAAFAEQARREGRSVSEVAAEARRELEKRSARELIALRDVPAGCQQEYTTWQNLNVICPPPYADDVPELQPVFRLMRLRLSPHRRVQQAQLRDVGTIPPASQSRELLKKHWKPNVTMYNPTRIAMWRGEVNVDPFAGTHKLFSSPEMQALAPSTGSCLYDYSAEFFTAAAAAIAKGVVRIELVLGDAFAMMDRIRFGTLQRQTEFPTTFDRIHLSNVPDYFGGYLSSFTTALGLLKPSPKSYITTNTLLNTPIWEGGMSPPFNSNVDSIVSSYTGVVLNETAAAFGAQLHGDPEWLGDYMMWKRPETLTVQLSRARLEQMLLRNFWKAVLPAQYSNYYAQYHPRENLNIHVFFRLIRHLLECGYPPHIFQDLLEQMLDNRLFSDIRPHTVIPIPLAIFRQTWPKVAVSCAPFSAELETACALWQPLLPFPICSIVLPAVDDLVRYSVELKRQRLAFEHAMIEASVIQTHFSQILCFGRPADMDAKVGQLRNKIINRHDPKTSLQLVTTCDWDPASGIATFLLPRSRAAAFIHQGFEVAILDHVFWMLTSLVAPCTAMVQVGDARGWDRTVRVPTGRARRLPNDNQALVNTIKAQGGAGGPGGMEPMSGAAGFAGLADLMAGGAAALPNPGTGSRTGAGGLGGMGGLGSLAEMMKSMSAGGPVKDMSLRPDGTFDYDGLPESTVQMLKQMDEMIALGKK